MTTQLVSHAWLTRPDKHATDLAVDRPEQQEDTTVFEEGSADASPRGNRLYQLNHLLIGAQP